VLYKVVGVCITYMKERITYGRELREKKVRLSKIKRHGHLKKKERQKVTP